MKATFTEQDLFGKDLPQRITPAPPEQAGQIIRLPDKPTCTPAEASRCLGVSVRQIRYWVQEGVLLAIDSSRNPVSGTRQDNRKRFWRVVVHRADDSCTPEANEFLTLAEFILRNTNKEIN